jgi:methylated-DNA-[protein]-cysteine S-methyltransferase
MEIAHIQTPLGIAKITGNENGISSISVSDEGTISIAISLFYKQRLLNSTNTLKERHSFSFKMNPQGTIPTKVWKALLDIPYGKTRTYLEQSKR